MRKYLQHCGRAGQARLPCSNTQCANTTVAVMGVLKKHQIQLAEGSKLSMVSSSPECLHCVYWGSARQGTAGLLWQLSSCMHAGIELSLHRGLTLCSTLTWWQCPPFSLPASRSPCVLGSAAQSLWPLPCIPRPLQDRGEGRRHEKLVSPPKTLLPEGCTSVPVPPVRSGNHNEAGEVEWNYLSLKGSWEI